MDLQVSGPTTTITTGMYDSLDRRAQATLEDNSLWKYNYDNRNELTGGQRFWSDWKGLPYGQTSRAAIS